MAPCELHFLFRSKVFHIWVLLHYIKYLMPVLHCNKVKCLYWRLTLFSADRRDWYSGRPLFLPCRWRWKAKVSVTDWRPHQRPPDCLGEISRCYSVHCWYAIMRLDLSQSYPLHCNFRITWSNDGFQVDVRESHYNSWFLITFHGFQ